TIQLIAAESQCSQSVLAALGSVVQNKTTEGFIGQRFHGGSDFVDQMEYIAVERAKQVFGAQYANVQPHSGTQANQIVLTAILEKDDKILSLALDQGGHVSHGAKVSFSGKFFNTQPYYVDPKTYLLNYDTIRELALKTRPKLIICGAAAYSRTIDFKKFREIADEVGAFLLADISHLAALVIGGAHPSPINYAHFTTTSTYKPGGPRGGLILMGKDYDMPFQAAGKKISLHKLIQKTTFPGVQGTPYLNHIAAKAVFFKEALTESYKKRQFKVIENAKKLSQNFVNAGYDVITGGTDNHMVLINVANSIPAMTGVIAQRALEECGIIINMNALPYDTRPMSVTSGMRLGTPIVTKNNMDGLQMDAIFEMINIVLKNTSISDEKNYKVDPSVKKQTLENVALLCNKFPII
ncbi:MAG TPA: serine hydroxymethyltransferase, partial [Sedimentisphaerales bacterium]|nr:serine hydroxymethyltransferase [Sedimentisphaerales bacterium]